MRTPGKQAYDLGAPPLSRDAGGDDEEGSMKCGRLTKASDWTVCRELDLVSRVELVRGCSGGAELTADWQDGERTRYTFTAYMWLDESEHVRLWLGEKRGCAGGAQRWQDLGSSHKDKLHLESQFFKDININRSQKHPE